MGDDFGEPRPLRGSQRSRDLVLNDLFAAGGLERILLRVQMLMLGRNARIAYVRKVTPQRDERQTGELLREIRGLDDLGN